MLSWRVTNVVWSAGAATRTAEVSERWGKQEAETPKGIPDGSGTDTALPNGEQYDSEEKHIHEDAYAKGDFRVSLLAKTFGLNQSILGLMPLSYIPKRKMYAQLLVLRLS